MNQIQNTDTQKFSKLGFYREYWVLTCDMYASQSIFVSANIVIDALHWLFEWRERNERKRERIWAYRGRRRWLERRGGRQWEAKRKRRRPLDFREVCGWKYVICAGNVYLCWLIEVPWLPHRSKSCYSVGHWSSRRRRLTVALFGGWRYVSAIGNARDRVGNIGTGRVWYD